MKTKTDKKEILRNQIITASHIYRDNLAGKVFLYVVGTESFEVAFKTDRFMHLTGVNSTLSAQKFYDKSKNSTLTTQQIIFDQKHPYAVAKKKLQCLILLPNLTNSLVCAVKDMKTVTLTYKLGITNIDFTIGLTENTDFYGNKINDLFLPRTLRTKDKSIENSSHAEFVDFIFERDASLAKYEVATYADNNKEIPDFVIPMLSETLINNLRNN